MVQYHCNITKGGKRMRTIADHNAASAKKGILRADQVMKIKQGLQAGEHPLMFATLYGVSEQTIIRIRDGKTWAWLKAQGNLPLASQAPLPDEVATSLATLQKLMEEERGEGGVETLNQQAEEVLRADRLAEELTGRKIERVG
jgi:hypothetical protein